MTGAGLALQTLLPGLLAQGTASAATVPARYRIRPGDVLEVTVAGRPDLSRLRTVQTTGTIWMPRIAVVRVEGLSPEQAGLKVAELLGGHEGGRFAVTVEVVEDRATFVRVAGAVKRPGHHKLGGHRRLVDVLLAAGGFTAEATGEVTVERRHGTFEDGSTVRRFHLPRGAAGPQVVADAETLLEPEDLVTVLATAPSKEGRP
jgi:polysaccharide export outer membrane protein